MEQREDKSHRLEDVREHRGHGSRNHEPQMIMGMADPVNSQKFGGDQWCLPTKDGIWGLSHFYVNLQRTVILDDI